MSSRYAGNEIVEMTCSRDDAVERSFKGPPSRERVDHPPIRVLEEGRKLLEVQYRSIFILLRRFLGAANLVDFIEWTFGEHSP